MKLDHAVLYQPAKPVNFGFLDLEKITKEMFEIMYQNNGIGLAAPQVGLSLQLFVMHVNKPKIIINPTIVAQSNSTALKSEGCLSFPGESLGIRRALWVTLVYKDLNNNEHREKFKGLEAVCVQHEYDHLLGICFQQRLKEQGNLEFK